MGWIVKWLYYVLNDGKGYLVLNREVGGWKKCVFDFGQLFYSVWLGL